MNSFPPVYHIGYSAGLASEQLESLMQDPAMLIIDTRKSPKSWRPGWSRDDIVEKDGVVTRGLKSKWGDRYRWAGKYLGNLNYWREGGPIDIADIETGCKGLAMYLREGHPLILLCECCGLEECHRYVIMQELKRRLPAVQFFKADGTPEPIVPDMRLPYKCLSIRPPHAEIICSAQRFILSGLPPKETENRDWLPRPSVWRKGTELVTLIHSSTTFEYGAVESYDACIPGVKDLMPTDEKAYKKTSGHIIGIARLVDVVTASESKWFRGKYGFVLKDATPFDVPIPWRGDRYFFDVPARVVEDVLPEEWKELAHAG